jgi:hypothetical protein
MRKPVGGLVSSLLFVFGCNDSTGPDEPQRRKASAQPEPSVSAGCPAQVRFDAETGRMTIVGPELSERIRAFYGLEPGEGGTGEAVITFTGQRAKVGENGSFIDGGDVVVDYRC